jgi:hypothetical protein
MKAYEQGTGAYFATPPVNLIYAFNASLTTITKSSEVSLEERFKRHEEASERVKSAAKELGLKQVSDPENAANGMTAVSFYFHPLSERLQTHSCPCSSTSPRDTPLQTFSHGSRRRASLPRVDCTRISRTATSASGTHGSFPCDLSLTIFIASGTWVFPLSSDREVMWIRSLTVFGTL